MHPAVSRDGKLFYPYSDPAGLSPAEQANGLQWKGTIKFNYDRTRTRYRANGVWEKDWEDWKDNDLGAPVAALVKKNGQWLVSDLRLSSRILSNRSTPTIPDVFKLPSQHAEGELVGLGFGASVSLDRFLASLKPLSCIEISSKPPAPSSKPPAPNVAPGHKMSDTSARMMQIAQANAMKGIHDDVCWDGGGDKPHSNCPNARFIGGLVCYKIDANGKCSEPTGEAANVPGDLVQPLNWATYSRQGVCSRQSPLRDLQIEVQLRNPAHTVAEKTFISCSTAGLLANVHQQLIDLGVEDDMENAPRVTAPSANNAGATGGSNALPTVPLIGSPVSSRRMATVPSTGLDVRLLPKMGAPVRFTLPPNTSVFVDMKRPDGWEHVVTRQAPILSGWVPPGSFPEQ